jgi:hypothetical protein
MVGSMPMSTLVNFGMSLDYDALDRVASLAAAGERQPIDLIRNPKPNPKGTADSYVNAVRESWP